jgi:hypothetical protein
LHELLDEIMREVARNFIAQLRSKDHIEKDVLNPVRFALNNITHQRAIDEKESKRRHSTVPTAKEKANIHAPTLDRWTSPLALRTIQLRGQSNQVKVNINYSKFLGILREAHAKLADNCCFPLHIDSAIPLLEQLEKIVGHFERIIALQQPSARPPSITDAASPASDNRQGLTPR